MPYFKTTDDCNLYYEMAGEGPGKPTIAFINGTLQTTVNWNPIIKGMPAGYRLLTYDAGGREAATWVIRLFRWTCTLPI